LAREPLILLGFNGFFAAYEHKILNMAVG